MIPRRASAPARAIYLALRSTLSPAQIDRRPTRDCHAGTRRPTSHACRPVGASRISSAPSPVADQQAIRCVHDHARSLKRPRQDSANCTRSMFSRIGGPLAAMPKRVRPRPGPHRPHLVLDLERRARPIDRAVLLRQPRRFRRLAAILLDRLGRAGREFVDDAQHQLRAQRRQPRFECRRRLRPDRSASAPAPRQGPASRPGVIWITLLPVSVSPRRIAHCTGAAPRYFGSSEPCKLMPPSRVVASVAGRRISP